MIRDQLQRRTFLAIVYFHRAAADVPRASGERSLYIYRALHEGDEHTRVLPGVTEPLVSRRPGSQTANRRKR
jgi:hypothetical protein